ncbi:MAG: acyltransferase [Proteobacteria bacterium]|nr:acyltransferase [Pseudomonadota bacterium]
MGILRLLLSLSVVLEHLGASFQLIGGWRAVQVFYFISGFYMALILGGKYENKSYGTFLGNRLLRLFPIYYLILILLGVRWLTSYFNDVPCEFYFPHCGQIVWQRLSSLCFIIFTQIAVIGQDWLFFLKLDPSGTFHFAKDGLTEPFQAYEFNINPISWTLGLELTFYLMAPFLLKRSHRFLISVVFVSLACRLIGYFKLGLTGLTWHYRFFPFELAVFVSGSLCYRFYKSSLRSSFEKNKTSALALSILMIVATMTFAPLSTVTENSTLIYYLLAALAVPSLFHLSEKNKIDRIIGDLSYPIYMIHMPICSLGKRFWTSNPLILILLVVALAYLINQLISKPVDKLRESRIQKVRLYFWR